MPAADSPSDLVALGLRAGERVRFRRSPGERWKPGRLEGVERDGSLAVRDAKGASRALRAARVQVCRRGRRGGEVWIPVTDLGGGSEQLDLL